MNAEKVSISLSSALVCFIEDYQNTHSCKSKSEVVQKAIKLLQQKELENYYRQADNEIDSVFEITAADGLEDETW